MPTERILHRRPFTLTLVPLAALLVLSVSACNEKASQTTGQAKVVEAPAPAPQAMEKVAPPAAEAPASDASAPETQAASVDGEAVYKKTCKTCHDAGVANAPKLGDSEAWAPRLAKGNDAMFEIVKNGLNAMPPKGACMSCSDEELYAAMEFMISQ